MLLNEYLYPVLLVSLDDVASVESDIATVVDQYYSASSVLWNSDGSLSSSNTVSSTLTDAQQSALESSIEEVANSDLTNLLLRFPIVFSDAIFPANVHGISSSTNKSIEYFGNTPVIVNADNSLSVEIHINNSLSTLSTSADILLALCDKLYSESESYEGAVKYKLSTRCSFFSPTFTLWDAYLTGINRKTVEGSQLEVVLLTFEKTTPSVSDVLSDATTVSESTEDASDAVTVIENSLSYNVSDLAG